MDGGPGPSGSGDQGDDNDQGDQGDDNDLADQGDDNGNAQNCDPATVLTSGAAVHDAELILTSSGASWKRVDLG
jgi:hypothetical protein